MASSKRPGGPCRWNQKIDWYSSDGRRRTIRESCHDSGHVSVRWAGGWVHGLPSATGQVATPEEHQASKRNQRDTIQGDIHEDLLLDTSRAVAMVIDSIPAMALIRDGLRASMAGAGA